MAAPRLSIVVLPFANLSDDREQQYFADGITEDLTTDLSRIADMLVISRNTAFTYRNRHIDTKQIGSELAVRYALEGSVRRRGNQIRVTAQLIDAESDAHLWAERFDGDLDDLFALQDEITSRIAIALNCLCRSAAELRSVILRGSNPEAAPLRLQGPLSVQPCRPSGVVAFTQKPIPALYSWRMRASVRRLADHRTIDRARAETGCPASQTRAQTVLRATETSYHLGGTRTVSGSQWPPRRRSSGANFFTMRACACARGKNVLRCAAAVLAPRWMILPAPPGKNNSADTGIPIIHNVLAR